MAIAFARQNIVSRGKGHSAVATAAYISGKSLNRHSTGETHNFTKKGKDEVVYNLLLLPEGADERFKDLETLWNEMEGAENRKDSQYGKHLILALPNELTLGQNIELTRRYVQQNFVDHGVAAQVAIHKKDGNMHAHVLYSTRRIIGGQIATHKARDLNPVFTKSKNAPNVGFIAGGDAWGKNWGRFQNQYFYEQGIDASVDANKLVAELHEGRNQGQEKQSAKRVIAQFGQGLSQTQKQKLVDEFCEKLEQNWLEVDAKINSHQGDLKAEFLITNSEFESLKSLHVIKLDRLKMAGFSYDKTLTEKNNVEGMWRELHRAVTGLELPSNSALVQECRDEILGEQTYKQQENIKRREEARHIALHEPESVLHNLIQEKTVFNERDIQRLLFKTLDESQEFQQAFDRIMADKSLIAVGLGEDGREYYTTQNAFNLEKDIQERADKLERRYSHHVPRSLVKRVCKKYQDMDRLNNIQARAVKHVIEANGITAVIGKPGTGKSHLAKLLNEIYTEQGYRMRGIAVANIAAKNLKKESGIESRSVASFLYCQQEKYGPLTSKDVVVLDEAGMVDAYQMQEVIKYVDQAKAKLILLGDHDQTTPIGGGAPLRALIERIGYVELDQIMRQKEEWQRTAVMDIARGRVHKAISAFAEHDGVHFKANHEEAIKYSVSKWMNNLEYSLTENVIASADETQAVFINQKAHALLLQKGLIKYEQAVKTQDKTMMLAVGERIRFDADHKGAGIKQGVFGEILSIEKGYIRALINEKEVSFKADEARLTYNYADHNIKNSLVRFDSAKGNIDQWFSDVWLDCKRADLAEHMMGTHINNSVTELNKQARGKLLALGILTNGSTVQMKSARIDVACGERILFLKNNKKMSVDNGTFAKILKINGNIITADIEGREVRFNAKETQFTHGYAVTIHKDQGTTRNTTVELIDERGGDKNKFLVGCSRHRRRLDMVVDQTVYENIDQLARGLGRRGMKDSLLDFPLFYSMRRGLDENSVLDRAVERWGGVKEEVQDKWNWLFNKAAFDDKKQKQQERQDILQRREEAQKVAKLTELNREIGRLWGEINTTIKDDQFIHHHEKSGEVYAKTLERNRLANTIYLNAEWYERALYHNDVALTDFKPWVTGHRQYLRFTEYLNTHDRKLKEKLAHAIYTDSMRKGYTTHVMAQFPHEEDRTLYSRELRQLARAHHLNVHLDKSNKTERRLAQEVQAYLALSREFGALYHHLQQRKEDFKTLSPRLEARIEQLSLRVNKKAHSIMQYEQSVRERVINLQFAPLTDQEKEKALLDEQREKVDKQFKSRADAYQCYLNVQRFKASVGMEQNKAAFDITQGAKAHHHYVLAATKGVEEKTNALWSNIWQAAARHESTTIKAVLPSDEKAAYSRVLNYTVINREAGQAYAKFAEINPKGQLQLNIVSEHRRNIERTVRLARNKAAFEIQNNLEAHRPYFIKQRITAEKLTKLEKNAARHASLLMVKGWLGEENTLLKQHKAHQIKDEIKQHYGAFVDLGVDDQKYMRAFYADARSYALRQFYYQATVEQKDDIQLVREYQALSRKIGRYAHYNDLENKANKQKFFQFLSERNTVAHYLSTQEARFKPVLEIHRVKPEKIEKQAAQHEETLARQARLQKVTDYIVASQSNILSRNRLADEIINENGRGRGYGFALHTLKVDFKEITFAAKLHNLRVDYRDMVKADRAIFKPLFRYVEYNQRSGKAWGDLRLAQKSKQPTELLQRAAAENNTLRNQAAHALHHALENASTDSQMAKFFNNQECEKIGQRAYQYEAERRVTQYLASKGESQRSLAKEILADMKPHFAHLKNNKHELHEVKRNSLIPEYRERYDTLREYLQFNRALPGLWKEVKEGRRVKEDATDVTRGRNVLAHQTLDAPAEVMALEKVNQDKLSKHAELYHAQKEGQRQETLLTNLSKVDQELITLYKDTAKTAAFTFGKFKKGQADLEKVAYQQLNERNALAAQLKERGFDDEVIKAAKLDKKRVIEQAEKHQKLQRPQYDIERINSVLLSNAEETYRQIFGEPKKASKRELRYSGGLIVSLAGTNTGQWYDFSGSGKNGGGPIQALSYQYNLSSAQAIERAAAMAGLGGDQALSSLDVAEIKARRQKAEQERKLQEQKEQTARIESAQSIWNGTVKITGTLAERYLSEHRKVGGVERMAIRYWPVGTQWTNYKDGERIEQINKIPAAVVAVQNEQGKITGVQRIYLDPQTGGKNKRMDDPKLSKGVIAGAAGIIQRGQKGGRVFVAEGPETAASLAMSDPSATVLSSLSVNNLSSLAGVLKTLKTDEIILAADNDGENSKTREATEHAVNLLKEQGVNIKAVYPSSIAGQEKVDWNDTLQKKGLSALKSELGFPRERHEIDRRQLYEQPAHELFALAKEAQGTIVENYVREKLGYRGDIPKTIRYLQVHVENGNVENVALSFGLNNSDTTKVSGFNAKIIDLKTLEPIFNKEFGQYDSIPIHKNKAGGAVIARTVEQAFKAASLKPGYETFVVPPKNSMVMPHLNLKKHKDVHLVNDNIEEMKQCHDELKQRGHNVTMYSSAGLERQRQVALVVEGYRHLGLGKEAESLLKLRSQLNKPMADFEKRDLNKQITTYAKALQADKELFNRLKTNAPDLKASLDLANRTVSRHSI